MDGLSKCSKGQIIGLSGCLLLIGGVFAPLVSALGISMNYYNTSPNQAYLLIGCAVAAGALLYFKWNKLSLIPSLISGLIVIVNFMDVMSKSSSGKDAEYAVNVQWGWGVLILGNLLQSFLNPKNRIRYRRL